MNALNRLGDSTSPYLLQHAANPVAWEPWDDASIGRARREGKPIFLSVGYSACHWCHVMAHECFESEAIAGLLNESFVNIKVDREERPDIDAVYMQAVQLLTGRGGWPMSVFLTPDLEPFFAGTYWPPEPRMGMPGFPQVVAAVMDAWRNRRDSVVTQAAEITSTLRDSASMGARETAGGVSEGLVEQAAASLRRSHDPEHGGFGRAPKFPHAMDLRLLLRAISRSGRVDDLAMVTRTLECMAAGGIHDQLGGGFARYSVDDRWLVPHFEKMLYDNALLSAAYLEAHLVTGRKDFAAVTRSTLDYVLRDLSDPAGGFTSAEDADSEGEEGRFYVWTPEEIGAILGPLDGPLFCDVYGVTPSGNFEGRSILHRAEPLGEVARRHRLDAAELDARLSPMRAKLLAARDERVRPGLDDKVLVAWNGLAIASLAMAGASFGEARYVAAAGKAAAFLLAECRDGDGRLAHQWRRGRASGLAFAEDLACLGDGLMRLYEATFEERWIAEACALADRLLGRDGRPGFVDESSGAIYQTSPEHERLIVRQPNLLDNATPGATGMTATMLARLSSLTGREEYRRAAERAVGAVSSIAARAPAAVPQGLIAIDRLLGPSEEDVIVGDPHDDGCRAYLESLRARFRPRSVVAVRRREAAPPSADSPRPLDPLFNSRPGRPDASVLYRCVGGVCDEPRAL